MADDATAQGETIVFETEISPDRLDDAAAHQFDLDDDALDDIDKLTIPKVGEAPPPRLFHARCAVRAQRRRERGLVRSELGEL